MDPDHRTPVPVATEAWLQPARGKRIPLEGTCSIGRAPENHVVLEVIKASRYHAAIHAQDVLEFWLVDLGSRNGTWHNGRRILRPTLLTDGDRILVADATFIFRQVTTIAAGHSLPTSGMETLVDFQDQPAFLLMADLCDFTVMTQRHSPEVISQTLTEWIGKGQKVIEQRHGQVGKYLGDGFLAYWTGENARPEDVVATVGPLRTLANEMPFRVALHHGVVTFGGSTALGEERMIGAEVNFIFRLERLASTLGVRCCLSASAHRLLSPFIATERLEGDHEVKGFPGRHHLFSAAW